MSDEFITCCTFGVLILRLRCLPLAVSASFTVTAFMEKKQKRCAFTCPHWMKDLHSNTCTKMYKMYNIPVVASPDWGCSPPPELPACISLCRFLHPEFPRCPHGQPWGPTFPSPLVPPRPGRGGEKRNTKLVIFSHTQSAAFVRHSGRKTYRIFWKRSCTFGMLETMS